MFKSEVINHFKTWVAVADALGISSAAVAKWPDPIPKGRAYELQAITNKRLKVNPAIYQKSVNAA